MAGRLCDNAIMTVTELKRELEKLDPEEQKVLTAYLLHLRVTRHEEWLADMDRRLDKRDPQRNAATGEVVNDDASLGRANATASKLSQSEIEAFRRRITDCWSPPVGLDSAQELVVVFRVLFNPDGSVKRGPDVISGKASASGPVFAESARRAILQCQPYTMLRRQTYDSWKDMEVAFKPSDMFR